MMKSSKSFLEIAPPAIFKSSSLQRLPSNSKFTSEIGKHSEPCSSFFRCILRFRDQEYMESVWLPGIHDEIRNWKGFRHRLIITPPLNKERNEDDELEFVVILYFIGIQNLRSWSTSPERAFWVNAARDKNIYVGGVEDHGGVLSQDIDAKDDDIEKSIVLKKLLRLPTRVELHDTMKVSPMAMPPPKFKLFLIIWTCVYFSNIINTFAGGKKQLMNYGFSFGAATFIELCHMMTFIIYALAPYLMSLHIIERWIKSPRCCVDDMTPVYRLFDQGLAIFAAPPQEKLPPEIMNRLDRLEGKVDRLKRANHDLLELINNRNDVLQNAIRESCNETTNDDETGNLLSYDEGYFASNHPSVGPYYNDVFNKDKNSCSVDSLPLNSAANENNINVVDPALMQMQQYHNDKKGKKLAQEETSISSFDNNDNKNINSNNNENTHINDNDNNNDNDNDNDNNKDNMKNKIKRKKLYHVINTDNDDTIDINNDNILEAASTKYIRGSEKIDKLSRVDDILFDGKKGLRESKRIFISDLENQNESRTQAVDNKSDDHKALTMVVTHLVKWEKSLQFDFWIKDMFREMSKFPGFLGQNTTPPLHDGDPYVNAFTFESYEELYAFLSSKERRQLMINLSPLLEATSVAQISEERIIQDAFSELFVATGGSALGRPPSLWKITILTVTPLQLIVWSIAGSIIPMMINIDINIALALFISTFITVLVNIYIGLPIMHLFFGNWLRIPRGSLIEMGSLNSILDAGLKKWQRLAVIIIYYGISLGFGFFYMLPKKKL